MRQVMRCCGTPPKIYLGSWKLPHICRYDISTIPQWRVKINERHQKQTTRESANKASIWKSYHLFSSCWIVSETWKKIQKNATRDNIEWFTTWLMFFQEWWFHSPPGTMCLQWYNRAKYYMYNFTDSYKQTPLTKFCTENRMSGWVLVIFATKQGRKYCKMRPGIRQGGTAFAEDPSRTDSSTYNQKSCFYHDSLGRNAIFITVQATV